MHRPLSLPDQARVYGAFIILMATLGLGMGFSDSVAESTPEIQSTPGTAQVSEPDIFLVDAQSIPAPNKEIPEQVLYLVRLEFGPDALYAPNHLHFGKFALTVDSGAICYTVESVIADTVVTANLPGDLATNTLCPSSDIECELLSEFTGEQHCTLQSGDTIYLLENSSVSQTGDGRHSYGIVDDTPATVYISGLQTGSPDSAPCGGGCH